MVTATPCKVRCECRGHLFCQVLADCSRDLKKKKNLKTKREAWSDFAFWSRLFPAIYISLFRQPVNASKGISFDYVQAEKTGYSYGQSHSLQLWLLCTET